jgi:hypothetical protein
MCAGSEVKGRPVLADIPPADRKRLSSALRVARTKAVAASRETRAGPALLAGLVKELDTAIMWLSFAAPATLRGEQITARRENLKAYLDTGSRDRWAVALSYLPAVDRRPRTKPKDAEKLEFAKRLIAAAVEDGTRFPDHLEVMAFAVLYGVETEAEANGDLWRRRCGVALRHVADSADRLVRHFPDLGFERYREAFAVAARRKRRPSKSANAARSRS